MEENTGLGKYRNPMDYIKVLFRRKWFIIIPTFLGLVIGIIACLLVPPTFESSTIILVEEEKVINPIIQNLAISTTAAQRMQNIREIILSWTSLVELTKKLNLAKDIRSQFQFESLVSNLRNNILVSMRPPNIIRISYQSKNPEETQRIAQSLTDILIEKNMQSQTKETDVAINFIQEQLEIYKRKIKQSEISKIQDQLKNLLVDSTEQHPLVRELRERLNNANKEIESGEYEVKGDEKQISSATKEALKEELDKLIDNEKAASAMNNMPNIPGNIKHDANNSVYKLLLMDKVDSARAQDIDVNINIYNMLLQRLETAKITQRLETSREGTRYTILDPARLPLRPTKPNKPLIILMGLFMGIASGVALVFGREFMDQSFVDIDDAKRQLTEPILAGISRIVTVEEVEKEKIKQKTLVIFSTISAIVLIAIAMIVAFLQK